MYKCFIYEKEIRFDNKNNFLDYVVDNLYKITVVEYCDKTTLRLALDDNKPLELEWFLDTLTGGDKMYQRQKSSN